jgi:hypothetical protein
LENLLAGRGLLAHTVARKLVSWDHVTSTGRAFDECAEKEVVATVAKLFGPDHAAVTEFERTIAEAHAMGEIKTAMLPDPLYRVVRRHLLAERLAEVGGPDCYSLQI